MATQVWFRNPDNYIRELIECGEYLVTWDRGYVVKKRIDPIQHAELYFGNAFPWRILLVGTQGTAEYRAGSTTPVAVYPTWQYGEDSIILEEMLSRPYGEDMEACLDQSVSPDERPVPGQEHRVIITELPPVNTGPGKAFIRYLKDLQEEYPKAIIHVHGTYSWKQALGMDFGAADIDPRTTAQKGRVHTPSGSILEYERLVAKPQWALALGFKPADLAIPRNRCMYNIKSAVWAGAHFTELYKFKIKPDGKIDYNSSDSEFVPAETKTPFMISSSKGVDGDKMLCDTCSLQDKCKYFRSGSVCTVPGAEPVKLSRMFKTRDADTIIDGLGTLLAANTNRLERGLQFEDVDGDLNPEVSKMMGQVFDQGVKLAKLLEPQRFSPGSKVQVNVGTGGATAVSGANPRQLVASVMRELEQQGIPRDKITPEMVQGVLEGTINPEAHQKAIAGTVVSSQEG